MRPLKESAAVAILYGASQAIATIAAPAAESKCYPIDTLFYSQVVDSSDRMDHNLCRLHCSTYVEMTHFALHRSGPDAFACSCGRAADISVSPLADLVCDLTCPNSGQETQNCGGINGEIILPIHGKADLSTSNISPDKLRLVESGFSTSSQKSRRFSSVPVTNLRSSGARLELPARSLQLSPTETKRGPDQALILTPNSDDAAALSNDHVRRQASPTESGACATPTDYILAVVGGRATAQQAYVGRIGNPYPTDCSLAAVFKPTGSGGLQIDGLNYGVKPGASFAPLRAPQAGSIAGSILSKPGFLLSRHH
ncbi:hypothetical protein K456DRAFT_34162 [Colletotrichum gloeosporioides 23]|nr:hypothetical protein K456DRAFT_34162 [Colletotrichum gloeosporioides 23]